MTRVTVAGRVAPVLAAALLLGACSSAVPTETPNVSQAGETVLLYKGPELEAALSYRFARNNPGEEWLLLDFGVTGTANVSVEIPRDRIWLRTPAGEIVPLATQQEFGSAYPQLASTIRRAGSGREPLDYFRALRPCNLGLFTAPGEGLALLSVWVSNREACFGWLFFHPPGGVTSGHYVLGIDLPESKVRIPFKL